MNNRIPAGYKFFGGWKDKGDDDKQSQSQQTVESSMAEGKDGTDKEQLKSNTTTDNYDKSYINEDTVLKENLKAQIDE